jgi:hypothetical protein
MDGESTRYHIHPRDPTTSISTEDKTSLASHIMQIAEYSVLLYSRDINTVD